MSAVGWGLAAVLLVALVRMRRRLELAARACHELRGSAAAIALAVVALSREPGGRRRALPFEVQLDRLRTGLDDLEAARVGRRAKGIAAPVALDRVLRGAAAGCRPAARARGRRLKLSSEVGATVVQADRGRLAQALGNLLSNAIEHGSGTVELRGRRSGGRVLLEVRDEGPGGEERRAGVGRGLRIAAAAADEAGGRLVVERREGATVAALELPAGEP